MTFSSSLSYPYNFKDKKKVLLVIDHKTLSPIFQDNFCFLFKAVISVKTLYVRLYPRSAAKSKKAVNILMKSPNFAFSFVITKDSSPHPVSKIIEYHGWKNTALPSFWTDLELFGQLTTYNSSLCKSLKNKLWVSRSISSPISQALHSKILQSELHTAVKLAQNNKSLKSIFMLSLLNLKLVIIYCLDLCCTKYIWLYIYIYF